MKIVPGSSTDMNAALYDSIGKQYRTYRLPDRRIAAMLSRELADAHTVVNLGAGVGAYEPHDRGWLPSSRPG